MEHVLATYEHNGVLVDTTAARHAVEDRQPGVKQLEQELNTWSGRELNWASNKQVNEFLYQELGLPIPPVKGTLRAVQINKDFKTGLSKPSMSEASLAYLASHTDNQEISTGVKTLLKHKKETKDIQFLTKLPTHANQYGKVHFQLGPNTETGRLACKNPNMQQMPPSAKAIVVAPKGCLLLCLDYSGLEWRILAHALAHKYGDWSLVEDIKNGIDPHGATAVRMFESEIPATMHEPLRQGATAAKKQHKKQRDASKILNYSINYGKTGTGLGVQLTGESGEPIGTKRGWELISLFYQANPSIEKFHKDVIDYGRRNGYVRTLLGRYRHLEGNWPKRAWSGGEAMRKVERLALNTPIQGGAMDIITVAMVTLHRHKRMKELGVQELLQNHDELLWAVPEGNAVEAQQIASHEMREAFGREREFCCPLDVTGGTGPNWAEAK
jgi:DNA polymerase-1